MRSRFRPFGGGLAVIAPGCIATVWHRLVWPPGGQTTEKVLEKYLNRFRIDRTMQTWPGSAELL